MPFLFALILWLGDPTVFWGIYAAATISGIAIVIPFIGWHFDRQYVTAFYTASAKR